MRVISLLYCVQIILISERILDINASSLVVKRSPNQKPPSDVLEIAKSTTPEIIKRYGYPAETHHVTTKDGYILTVHRMKREGGQPFFLQHGLLDSSATYILMGPKIGLGYLLWDLGYDVWLGNARGNRYSKKHKSLNPKEKDFWQFSWHEIGIYDLPAMIDYILNATEYQKLFYAGHSQGTTSFFVMCSRRPEFNKKIILMQALAPVAFMTHIKTPYARIFNRFRENALRTIGEFEMLPQGKMASMCVSSENLENVMINMFFNMVGKNEKEFNRTMWPAICYHLPAGAATNQVVHYSQLIQSGRFCEYDYGPQINEERYGTKIPPKYDLSKVTAPVALYYSENDYLTAPVDVEYLYTQLGNPVEKYFVPMPEFNHMDFVWGIHVRKLVYERFLQVMQNYTNKGSVENVTEEV